MSYSARSPGKLILSGEHSVVYGAPAIVAAIARYTTVRFHPIQKSRSLRTVLKGITNGRNFPLEALDFLRDLLDERFELFRNGKLPVRNILQRPDDLMLYTLAQIARQIPIPGQNLLTPGHLQTESELPLGAGMGSSAAVIAATMVLYEHLLNRSSSLQERFQRIRFCERLQHGNGSAIDAAAVTYGSIHYLNKQIPRKIHHKLDNWYWILTGIPESSTGECVAHVRKNFAKDALLWDAFEKCTETLCYALQTNQTPKDALRENHQLLTYIGVVPNNSARLIQYLESIDGSAKISGAGSICGDKGGIVIVHHPDLERLSDLLNRHFPSLSWGKIDIATEGASMLPRFDET